MNYYERHLGDYAKGTGHLSMLEHGAYTLLLDRYYSTEKGVPVDQVYRVAKARSKPEKAAVDAVLTEFFTIENGAWVKNRVQEELASAHARIEAARTNGKSGGRPRKNPVGSESETQGKPTGLFLGSKTETQTITQTKALQSPISNQESQSRDAASGTDPRKQLFDLGKSILGTGAGSLISKAISQTDESTVGAILGEMALSPKADPKAYFVAATKPKERRLAV